MIQSYFDANPPPTGAPYPIRGAPFEGRVLRDGESLDRALVRLRGLDRAILRRSRRNKILEQMMRDVRDLGDSTIERLGVRLRWLRRSADLAHELESCGVNFFVVRGRLEIMKDVNVATHVHEASRPRDEVLDVRD
jgi:hypothetical protein